MELYPHQQYVEPLVRLLDSLPCITRLYVPAFDDISRILTFSRARLLQTLHLSAACTNRAAVRELGGPFPDDTVPTSLQKFHVTVQEYSVITLLFQNHIYSHLRNLHIWTLCSEKPELIRYPFQAVSASCPGLTVVWISFSGREPFIAHDCSPSFDDLRNILQCRKVSDFFFQHKALINLKDSDLEEMALTWSNLQKLTMQYTSEAEFTETEKPTLLGLFHLTKHCPKLWNIQLILNTRISDTPSFPSKSFHRGEGHLSSISVDASKLLPEDVPKMTMLLDPSQSASDMSAFDEQNLRSRLRSCYGHRNVDISTELERRRLGLEECGEKIAAILSNVDEEHLDKLDELRREQERLKSIIDICLSLQAPVKLLPPELLSKIFHTVHDDVGRIFIFQRSDNSSIPALPLSQVCSLWRNVALSCPKLWCRMNVYLDHSDYTSWAVETCLARSGNVRLELGITGSFTGTKALKCLAESSYRWYDVSLSVEAEIYDEEVLQHIGGNLPVLERLDVHDESKHPGESALLRNLIRQTPNLRFFSAKLLPWSFACLDGTQAKVVDLFLPLSDELVVPLKQSISLSPDIETLSIASSNLVHIPHPPRGDPLTIPTLQSLTVGFPNDQAEVALLHLLLRLFTLPYLATLNLNGIAGNNALPEDVIASFLKRSTCDITTLSLRALGGTKDVEIIKFLRSLPSLKALFLYDRNILHPDDHRIVTKHFLRRFHRTIDGDPPSFSSQSWDFLPRLTTLKLTVPGAHVDEIIREVKEMLKSGRRQLSSGIAGNAFGVLGPVELRKWVKEEFRQYQCIGVDVL
ncbi:hypothetical protein D9758_007646 [Tetrapyrgos nigripes]|uniref:F-box domain-containing protein n=1 Tax=Tetrapyrgos nigripes TaxID=182062 RepID=A0A8H5LJP3_9AGAR|nr:hypothetical protein D9758_007646 [Tetrapyrgos nigripes]